MPNSPAGLLDTNSPAPLEERSLAIRRSVERRIRTALWLSGGGGLASYLAWLAFSFAYDLRLITLAGGFGLGLTLLLLGVNYARQVGRLRGELAGMSPQERRDALAPLLDNGSPLLSAVAFPLAREARRASELAPALTPEGTGAEPSPASGPPAFKRAPPARPRLELQGEWIQVVGSASWGIRGDLLIPYSAIRTVQTRPFPIPSGAVTWGGSIWVGRYGHFRHGNDFYFFWFHDRCKTVTLAMDEFQAGRRRYRAVVIQAEDPPAVAAQIAERCGLQIETAEVVPAAKPEGRGDELSPGGETANLP